MDTIFEEEKVFYNENCKDRTKITLTARVRLDESKRAHMGLWIDCFFAEVGALRWCEDGLEHKGSLLCDEANFRIYVGYECSLARKDAQGNWKKVPLQGAMDGKGSDSFIGHTKHIECGVTKDALLSGDYKFSYDGNKTGGFWCAKNLDGSSRREVHCSSTAGSNREFVYDLVSFAGESCFTVGERARMDG